MKRSMKKSAVFVMMAAIAMFILAATVTADPRGNLWEQYAVTSGGTCMIAPFGFNPNLTPINGVGIISMVNREGNYTFENDGTGSATLNGSVINLSYPGPGGAPVPPSAASQTISLDFTYTVTDGGMITITQVPGTYSTTFTSGPNKGLTYHVRVYH